MLKIPPEFTYSFSLPEEESASGSARGFQQHLKCVYRPPQEREHFRFLRTLGREYTGEYRQWKMLFHQRVLSPQTWRLHGGRWAGTCIDIRQEGALRMVCIRCPSEHVAASFRQVKTLIESACSGPWLTLTLNIRTDCE